jgi:outer membrane protein OmpA-like peptidoglycan-associated protein
MSSLYGHESFENGDGGGSWPALSDLLAATTLIFCVLFAVTVVPAIRDRGKLQALQNSLDSLQVDLGRNRGLQVQRVGDYLRITIGGDVVFPQNRFEIADMNPAGRLKLDSLARTLAHPSTLEKIDQIQVVGHTSSEGSDEKNWRLSSARAGTIALFLVNEGGLPVCKITALGRGRYYPIDAARARRDPAPDPQDRRIEIEIRPVVLNDSTQQKRRNECVQQPGPSLARAQPVAPAVTEPVPANARP